MLVLVCSEDNDLFSTPPQPQALTIFPLALLQQTVCEPNTDVTFVAYQQTITYSLYCAQLRLSVLTTIYCTQNIF